jgi:hypothetical protein
LDSPADPTASLKASRQRPTCGDCYFRRQGLCALALERPCPTFRAATHVLEPPRQAPLVLRPAGAY